MISLVRNMLYYRAIKIVGGDSEHVALHFTWYLDLFCSFLLNMTPPHMSFTGLLQSENMLASYTNAGMDKWMSAEGAVLAMDTLREVQV